MVSGPRSPLFEEFSDSGDEGVANQKPHPFDEVTRSVSPTGPPGKKFTVYFVPFPSPFSYSLVYSIKFQIVHFTYFFLVHIKN